MLGERMTLPDAEGESGASAEAFVGFICLSCWLSALRFFSHFIFSSLQVVEK